MKKYTNIFDYYGIKLSREADDDQATSQPTSKTGTEKDPEEVNEDDASDDNTETSETETDENDADEQVGSQPGSTSTSGGEQTQVTSGKVKNFKDFADKVDAEQQTSEQPNSVSSPTIVISAFVCSGKSTFAANCDNVKDLESSLYSKKPDGSKSDEFPGNYIAAIKWQLVNNNWKYLLVSSHQDVRKAMKDAGIKFYLFYPALERKDEVIRLCQERGNNAEFIELIKENYEAWVGEMSKEENAYPLQEGEFLSMELFEHKYKFLYQ